MRSERARTDQNLPKVDWTRYHLQILFVDRSDTVRARVAAGLLERIAEWNGYGRALYPCACGVEAAQEMDWSTSAALMGMAGMLGIRAKLFAAQPEQLVYEDFDRCDLLIAMDDDILGEALAIAGSENDQAWYAPRCTTLTRFAPYCGTAILNPGGTGVLEPELRQIVAPVVGRAQAAQGITRPDLRMGSAEWNRMIQDMAVSCAGLVQYLADQWPPELQEGWLQY
ncbi:g4690 [Coccomyxa viridis]|uniref:G4690 protein n=1 Tax=Coccomyxa viridis TaxID=1274662 RepID=A0ABP1FQW9_9CHLO